MSHISYSIFAAEEVKNTLSPKAPKEDLSKDPGLSPELLNSDTLRDVSQKAPPDARDKNVFVAVTGSETQQETSATGLVVAAYGLFWLILFVLVWVTYRGQERLSRRVEAVEKSLLNRENPS
jgi:hypothetical protein